MGCGMIRIIWMHQNPVRTGSAGSAFEFSAWPLSSSQSIESCSLSGSSKPVSDPDSEASKMIYFKYNMSWKTLPENTDSDLAISTESPWGGEQLEDELNSHVSKQDTL